MGRMRFGGFLIGEIYITDAIGLQIGIWAKCTYCGCLVVFSCLVGSGSEDGVFFGLAFSAVSIFIFVLSIYIRFFRGEDFPGYSGSLSDLVRVLNGEYDWEFAVMNAMKFGISPTVVSVGLSVLVLYAVQNRLLALLGWACFLIVVYEAMFVLNIFDFQLVLGLVGIELKLIILLIYELWGLVAIVPAVWVIFRLRGRMERAIRWRRSGLPWFLRSKGVAIIWDYGTDNNLGVLTLPKD